jgi:hypothetical protein
MSLADLVFLLLAAVAVTSLATAAGLAATGRMARGGRILRRVAIGAAVYLIVVIAVSALTRTRVVAVGEAQCFDDWCVTVSAVDRHAEGANTSYDVWLILSNHGRGRAMGELGTVAYLVDARGHRFDPAPDPQMVPFSTKVAPGESVIARRHYVVPGTERSIGLVYTHEGGFPIEWLIVGAPGWFKRPPVVRLN